MKNTRAQRLLGLVMVATVAGTLAACGSAGGDTAGTSGDSSSGPEGWRPNDSRPENEIHVFVLGDAAASAEQAAADRFNENSDVKVVVDNGPTQGTEYNTTIRTQMGTANAPDVFMSWGASGIDPLLKAQALLPLDSFIAEDPKLKDMFVPAVFDEEVVDGKAYGVPMRGVAPEFLYYNKKVLDDAGLKPAETWNDLMDQVQTLKGQGVIPIGLAGADKWPQQIWLQFMYAREIGNEQVSKGLAGDASVWQSEGSKAALTKLRELIDAGAFGQNFASVSYGSDGSAALLAKGKSAYELMGSWHYATVGDTENLGWTSFPSIDGGQGQPGEIAGNLSNFYNVAADTRYPDTVRDFLKELYSPEFQKDEIALGNLPPTTDATTYVDEAADLDAQTKEHLKFVSKLVNDAPTFQLSWDQTVPAAKQVASQDAAADFFNGAIDADGFIQQMVDITSQ